MDHSSPRLATSLAKSSAVIAHRLVTPPSPSNMAWCSTPPHSAEPNATAIEAKRFGVSTLRPSSPAASASPGSSCWRPTSSSEASAVGATRPAGCGTTPCTGCMPPQRTRRANDPTQRAFSPTESFLACLSCPPPLCTRPPPLSLSLKETEEEDADEETAGEEVPEPCLQSISFDEGDGEGKQRAIREHRYTPGQSSPTCGEGGSALAAFFSRALVL